MSNHTSMSNWRKAVQVLKYLCGPRTDSSVFSASQIRSTCFGWCSASFVSQEREGQGQQGFFISNGSAPVVYCCSKLKIIIARKRSLNCVELRMAQVIQLPMGVRFSGCIIIIRHDGGTTKLFSINEAFNWSPYLHPAKGLPLAISRWSSSPPIIWRQISWRTYCLYLRVIVIHYR